MYKKILIIIVILLAIVLLLFGFIKIKISMPGIFPPKDNITRLLNNTSQLNDKLTDYNEQIKDQIDQDESNKQAIKPEYYQQGPLTLPRGFSISVFAENLGKPRVIINAPNGGFLVSIPDQGKVVKIADKDGDGKAEEIKTIVDKLNRPHGLLLKCYDENQCQLYVAETSQVSLFDYDLVNDQALNKKKIIDLPDGGGHWTRTIIETPWDEREKTQLLISVGSTCNVCNETDWRRAKVLIADLDGNNLREFAAGLRNAPFMAIHPVTGNIWVTEMGRDWLGDDLPPDEINILAEGQDYGWPICYGQNIHDNDFDKNQYIQDPCAGKIPAHIDIPAHSAPLGLAFIPEEGWPEDMWYDLLVAYHGSWNRSTPTGYKIVRYRLDAQGNYQSEEDFISGWLNDGSLLGRPVDILIQPGGVMYITDDKAGVVYRVTYQP